MASETVVSGAVILTPILFFAPRSCFLVVIYFLIAAIFCYTFYGGGEEAGSRRWYWG